MEDMKDKLDRIEALGAMWDACCKSNDIPVVQAQVNALGERLAEDYDAAADAALDGLLLGLREAEREGLDRLDKDFLLSLALSLVIEVETDLSRMPAGTRRLAAAAAGGLLRAGARFIEEPLGAPAARRLWLIDRAGEDLEFWYEHAFPTSPARAELLRQVERYLTDPAQRSSEAARLAWLNNAREVILKVRQALRLAADSWGYRWYNVGILQSHLAAKRAGVRLVAANNPPAGPDARTTAFCRWVHGKEIDAPQALSMLLDYLSAEAAGSPETAKAAMPFLTAEEVAGKGRSFSALFAGLGIPPYHHLCRTVMVEVRGS